MPKVVPNMIRSKLQLEGMKMRQRLTKGHTMINLQPPKESRLSRIPANSLTIKKKQQHQSTNKKYLKVSNSIKLTNQPIITTFLLKTRANSSENSHFHLTNETQKMTCDSTPYQKTKKDKATSRAEIES